MMGEETKRPVDAMAAPGAETYATAMQQQEQRKKRKLDKKLAMESGQWMRCMFKVVRKNRYCNNARVEGLEYCGNHVPADATAFSKKSQQYDQELRVRVPCPIDGAHSVYKFDLEKHVKVCNATRVAAMAKLLPYYSEDINSGTHAKETGRQAALEDEQDGGDGDDSTAKEGEREHDGPSEQQEKSLIDRLARLNFAGLAAHINQVYDRCVGEIPLQKRYHKCCDALMEEKTAAGASKNVLRHIEQQASILGNMEEVHLLDSDAAFIELGAGRGMLSLAMAQALPGNLYVLIDRAGGRGKADHFIREASSDQKQPTVMRAKIDIRHLNLAGMPELADKSVVGMSKHLCGVATDLSIRSLHTLPCPQSQQEQVKSSGLTALFKGVAIALCCHHACNWADYVNPQFINEQGFTSEEFTLLAAMTSWATCAMSGAGDSVQYVLNINHADRAILGRKCKRILDTGRMLYLRQLGLEAKLVHYCTVEASVENCLLLAWRSSLVATSHSNAGK